MNILEIIERYESESGNVVENGHIFDLGGNYICKFSENIAKMYHNIVIEERKERKET